MNIKKRIETLRKEVTEDTLLRQQWDLVLQSDAFKKISELIFLEACDATQAQLGEHTAISERRTFKAQSAQEVLARFHTAHIPVEKPVALPGEWEHAKLPEP